MSLFGSSYHESEIADRRQRARDAADAPRLRREVEELRSDINTIVAWLHRQTFPFDWSSREPAPACIKALLAERYANEDGGEVAEILWAFDQEQVWDA